MESQHAYSTLRRTSSKRKLQELLAKIGLSLEHCRQKYTFLTPDQRREAYHAYRNAFELAQHYRAEVLPLRQRIDWRRKHPREMAQAIIYVDNYGGGAENVTKALAALQDDAVLNVDGIFDKLTRGTYTRWIKDWDNYIGSIDDFCKPSEPVLSHRHLSPVYDSTKTKMREKLEQLGAADAHPRTLTDPLSVTPSSIPPTPRAARVLEHMGAEHGP